MMRLALITDLMISLASFLSRVGSALPRLFSICQKNDVVEGLINYDKKNTQSPKA
jgi:hypothetical protein